MEEVLFVQRDEAVQAAKSIITELYRDERIGQIGLEELRFDPDSDEWRVTIGYAHPAAKDTILPDFAQPNWTKRRYKVVHLKDGDGRFVAVTDRFLGAWE